MTNSNDVRRFQHSFSPRSILLFSLGLLALPTLGMTPIVLTLSSNSTCNQIQQALDSLPPNGEVLLAPGTFEIHQPILLRHDTITLRGSGPTTILHLADNANCPVVILAPPITQIGHSATNLCLADMVIDGNRKNQHVELWGVAADGSEINNNGVQIWNVTDAVVQHVVCCRCRSGGLVTADVHGLAINDFDSYDNQFDGLACYETTESHFADLRLHDNLAAGISVDLDFNHNCVTNAILAGNDLGIFMRDSRNNSFQGLTISKSHHGGVFMAQTFGSTPKGWGLCPDTECIGNEFENLMVDDCGGQAFQVNDISCTNNAISGAQFLRNGGGGLAEPLNNLVSEKEVVSR